jgi:hypothetical protein
MISTYLLRTIVGRDDQARTAHQAGADTDSGLLPDRIADLLGQRENAVILRLTQYRGWNRVQEQAAERERSIGRHPEPQP